MTANDTPEPRPKSVKSERISLLVPPALRAHLIDLATSQKRTLNAQCVYLLEQATQQRAA